MAGIRVPLTRSENNGTLAAGANNQIFELKYSMAAVTNFHPGNNQAQIESRYPIAIYRYKLEIVGDFYGVIFQTYGDTDDLVNLSTYDLSNDEFCLGLKQQSLFGGTSSAMAKTTISYAAKKNPKKLQSQYGKWKRPPIYLGPGAGNLFNISVKNMSDSINRTFQVILEIPSWRQFI